MTNRKPYSESASISQSAGNVDRSIVLLNHVLYHKQAKAKAAAMMCFLMLASAMSSMADEAKPQSVYFTAKKKAVYISKAFRLKVKMRPTNADENPLCWKICGKKDIVKFDDDD